MKKEYSYLVAGRFLVDLLKEKGIIYSKEDLRRFNIGLLNIAQTLETDYDFKLKRISEPYYMGYYFQIWLNKETGGNSLYSAISGTDFSDENKHEHEAMHKYKLSFPDVMPFFSPNKNVKFENYVRINSKLKDKIDITIDPNLSPDELKQLDDNLILLMNLTFNFYYEHEKKIISFYKKLFVIKKDKNYPVNSVWGADEMQYDYYRRRWIEICKMTKPDSIDNDNAVAFFDGLLQELEDVDFNGKKDRDSWEKEDEKIIRTSKLITITSGIATLFSTAEEFSEDDNIILVFSEIAEKGVSLPNIIKFVLKIVRLFIPVMVTAISAHHTYLVQKSEREAHRETWLRHRLYYSKIIMEIEKFCSGSGEDYKAIRKYDKWKIHECVNKFQENITALKKEDYANFFKNMDCVNYDPEND